MKKSLLSFFILIVTVGCLTIPAKSEYQDYFNPNYFVGDTDTSIFISAALAELPTSNATIRVSIGLGTNYMAQGWALASAILVPEGQTLNGLIANTPTNSNLFVLADILDGEGQVIEGKIVYARTPLLGETPLSDLDMEALAFAEFQENDAQLPPELQSSFFQSNTNYPHFQTIKDNASSWIAWSNYYNVVTYPQTFIFSVTNAALQQSSTPEEALINYCRAFHTRDSAVLSYFGVSAEEMPLAIGLNLVEPFVSATECRVILKASEIINGFEYAYYSYKLRPENYTSSDIVILCQLCFVKVNGLWKWADSAEYNTPKTPIRHDLGTVGYDGPIVGTNAEFNEAFDNTPLPDVFKD